MDKEPIFSDPAAILNAAAILAAADTTARSQSSKIAVDPVASLGRVLQRMYEKGLIPRQFTELEPIPLGLEIEPDGSIRMTSSEGGKPGE